MGDIATMMFNGVTDYERSTKREMKEQYITPEVELIQFSSEDVIATSNPDYEYGGSEDL